MGCQSLQDQIHDRRLREAESFLRWESLVTQYSARPS